MTQTSHSEQSIYFSPILPWQKGAWARLLERYDRLPHGLLFSGMQGIGKRAFVWRFVAWLLCDNRESRLNLPADQQVGCGQCQSCQWLASGTHQDLQVLPAASLPVEIDSEQEQGSTTKSGSQSKKGATKNSKAKAGSKAAKSETASTSIKVDDIRQLQPFMSQGSSGRRVCVIDNADSMTVAAANALLKTLEEPRDGIHVLLISDMPARLLATIKSRVQQVSVYPIQRLAQAGSQDESQAASDSAGSHLSQRDQQINSIHDYLMQAVKEQALLEYTDEDDLAQQISQALTLANGAPLAALEMLSSSWYSFRQIWLNAWIALRTGRRSSVAASDYWQKTLAIEEFVKLSEFMLMDLSRLNLGVPSLQTDIEFDEQTIQLPQEKIYAVLAVINDIKQACQQNVQDKMAYDHLLAELARL
ncbi:DNA polymerase III subunit delta' [Psychrobacter sp. FDAARGOS_221]|uniref:DNA polymerase III subunit delta' n=1 Tax=Psychrobacter sp. FDAARGOS_221 TaxID=1975705 RepID=UPI000BB52D20|nr:DNA polymerase III subunit delta' [Psychrobacter sp. FDAARGOS_221]PNK59716.1 DNA polymerase III subunit delta' [Psychrobacter sp. FDAARGOS_221]